MKSKNPLLELVRDDLEGRFNEVDVLRRQWDRIRVGSEGNIVPPFEVLIHPSSACNLLCSWCIGDHVPLYTDGRAVDASKQSANRLPDSLRNPLNMQRLIEGILSYRKEVELDGALQEFRVQNIQFSGLIGDPLVSREAILSVIPMLTQAKVRTGIFTNALLMNDECIERFQEIDYVSVSLDAGRSDTYDFLKSRRANSRSFELALQNIGRLASSQPSSKLEVNSSFVLFPENFEEVYDAAVLLKDRGVRALKVKQDISGQRLLNPNQAARAAQLLDRIEDELVDNHFKLFRIHKAGDPNASARRFSTCRITDLMAAIGSDGNLYPCNYHPRPGGASYGNAIERPFADVWESAQRLKIQSRLPLICPAVCDPFKNRSNAMLEAVHGLRQQLDEDDLRHAIQEAIDAARIH